MGDINRHHHQQHTRHSSLGIGNFGVGEMVEVQGGHIIRSTGRKDRHSKVCTAKGPRDRRVRLSAHTAIQFYDIQDRLGYDRPSKAVDWLIKKAKPAIDQLAELPPWKPTKSSSENTKFIENQAQMQQQNNQQFRIHHDHQVGTIASNIQHYENSTSFLAPTWDSDTIFDTMKSLVASAKNNPSAIFPSFSSQDRNLLPRISGDSHDLRASLLHQHNQQVHSHHFENQNEQPPLFSENPLGFDGQADIQRMVAWNASGVNTTDCGGGGFVFNSQPTPPLLQPLFGQMQLFSQGGPLQSSNSPWLSAWMESSATAIDTNVDHHPNFQHYPTVLHGHPSSTSEIRFAPGVGEFFGFHIPAQIQGDQEEEYDGLSDKPSSASSGSCH